jgi:LysR family glycine cleavage system transcriptional activator
MTSIALPSLAALQSFEAAARLGSFTKAAGERSLTHSAISRNIQAVEHWCGETLFERRGPRVVLSEAGQRLRQRLGEPLRALHSALDLDAVPSDEQRLRILMLSSIASTWLVPRLPAFCSAHPHITLSVETGYDMVSLPPLEPVVAIRFGHFDRAGLTCQRLWFDHMVAVAAPDWVTTHGSQPAKWPGHQLLRHSHEPWPQRLPYGTASSGVKLAEPGGHEFNDALLLVQAAAQGCGVAWARASLAVALASAGKLTVLSQNVQDANKSVWSVCRTDMVDAPPIRDFCQWAADQSAWTGTSSAD